ncbi:MAG: rhamnulokinase family protein [Eggerthellaceae bacterium]|nr:rhamnulokinase family protein [Eggerthellaceae bacterium]
MTSSNCYAAVDIGASSGRVVVGTVRDGRIELTEIHRFDNIQKRSGGHDCWDIEMLFRETVAGLAKCKEAGFTPKTIGIDTWGVDFVLLDKDDQLIGDAVAYRDDRTNGMYSVADRIMTPDAVYRRTGIQRQPFNTIYQLIALKREHPEELEQAESFLMIPDYLAFLLTGTKVNEYTNATTTCLLNARTQQWDSVILDAFGIPQKMFCDVVMPGADLGVVKPEIEQTLGYAPRVIAPATHDTGSAYLAVPARDNDAVFLSSGTWSLLGVENEGPITSDASRFQNFTNEGGYELRFRFLKNIMGLWMIQSIRRELNGVSYVEGKQETEPQAETKATLEAELPPFVGSTHEMGFGDLIEEAKAAQDFEAHVNVNDDRFLAPDSMIDEIRLACFETGQAIPTTVGELMRCVYISLSTCYAESIEEMASLTGRTYTSINIVGGGCQDAYLNELTTKACGIPVFAGPIEGTSLGNLIVQMIASGQIEDLQTARDMIRASFDIDMVDPQE